MEKAVLCMREGETTSLWTSGKIDLPLFTAINNLPRKMHYVSSHFHRSDLKAYAVSKSEETIKVE